KARVIAGQGGRHDRESCQHLGGLDPARPGGCHRGWTDQTGASCFDGSSGRRLELGSELTALVAAPMGRSRGDRSATTLWNLTGFFPRVTLPTKQGEGPHGWRNSDPRAAQRGGLSRSRFVAQRVGGTRRIGNRRNLPSTRTWRDRQDFI